MGFGDKYHGLLLRRGWCWDGGAYRRTTPNGVELTLSPATLLPPSQIPAMRRGIWKLLVNGTEAVQFGNGGFNEAAQAVFYGQPVSEIED